MGRDEPRKFHFLKGESNQHHEGWVDSRANDPMRRAELPYDENGNVLASGFLRKNRGDGGAKPES